MRVKVKFCGMTRREDLEAAAELGADAVGLVFVPGTPRVLSISQARELLRGLPPFMARVGVFANEDPVRIRSIRADLSLTTVQLHGRETALDCQVVGGSIIKVFRLSEARGSSLPTDCPCDAYLLEADAAARQGEGGVPFDWRSVAESLPGRRIILAGGLTSENVEEAIRSVRPYAVDVSRGIESAPCVKDRRKMMAFLQAVQRASA